VKDDDLAIATHGRGFWIMDNITPLRQLSPAEPPQTKLVKPQLAVRYRSNNNTDTPLPPDEPAGENPPDGAIIDYSLGKEVSGPVTLEIRDWQGNLVRRYASTDPAPTPDPQLKIPSYWVKPRARLSAEPGWHRFVWDLHGQPLPQAEAEYPMTAIAHQTSPRATAPWVLPGDYQVTLKTNEKSVSEPLRVKMDPRIRVSASALTEQFVSSSKVAELRGQLEPIGKTYAALVSQVNKLTEAKIDQSLAAKVEDLRKKLETFANPTAVRARRSLEFDLLGKSRQLFNVLQQVDAAPTSQQAAAVNDLERATEAALKNWETIPGEVTALNTELARVGMAPIQLEETSLTR
jgi:hypothetical protein